MTSIVIRFLLLSLFLFCLVLFLFFYNKPFSLAGGSEINSCTLVVVSFILPLRHEVRKQVRYILKDISFRPSIKIFDQKYFQYNKFLYHNTKIS